VLISGILTKLASKTIILSHIWKFFCKGLQVQILSFYDGFSRYNQVLVNHEDNKNSTTLTTISLLSQITERIISVISNRFIRCRMYGISLNPKKTILGVIEEKLLGHIVSKDVVRNDTKRIKGIQKIELLRNQKESRSFLGKVNFIKHFIPNI
jgi:hypothetical protein